MKTQLWTIKKLKTHIYNEQFRLIKEGLEYRYLRFNTSSIPGPMEAANKASDTICSVFYCLSYHTLFSQMTAGILTTAMRLFDNSIIHGEAGDTLIKRAEENSR